MLSLLTWTVATFVAAILACPPGSWHEDTLAGETHLTAGEAEWVRVAPPVANDLVRPTPEERDTTRPDAQPAADDTDDLDDAVDADGMTEEATLPDWVPEAGRLTIIEAPDRARNLGMEDTGY